MKQQNEVEGACHPRYQKRARGREAMEPAAGCNAQEGKQIDEKRSVAGKENGNGKGKLHSQEKEESQRASPVFSIEAIHHA
jgi:hypothetical protein